MAIDGRRPQCCGAPVPPETPGSRAGPGNQRAEENPAGIVVERMYVKMGTGAEDHFKVAIIAPDFGAAFSFNGKCIKGSDIDTHE